MTRHPVSLLVLPFLAAAVAQPAAAQDEAAQFQSVVEKRAPSLATVKAVVKSEMKGAGQSNAQESRVSMQGVVVSADGLVMVSNSPFSPKRYMEMLGAPPEAMQGMTATPSAIKVVFGSEEKEYDAFLAATDTNLDLAFVKVEGLADRKLTAVEFDSDATLTVGQKLVQVGRLARAFDYAPYYQSGRICGAITKPRTAWMLEGSMSILGLPVFSMDGSAVGVLSTITGGARDESGGESASIAMMMRLLTGTGGPNSVFVLPGSVIKALVEQAALRAVDVAADRAKKKAVAPKVEDKPATTKPAPTKPPAPPKKKP